MNLKKIKLLLLSDPNNTHTMRWVKSLSEQGISIFVFGIGALNTEFYDKMSNVLIYSDGNLSDKDITEAGRWSKLKYLKVLPSLKRVIREYKPDVVHAHYASSYGLLGVLSGFHPYILTIWGSDIFCFPKTSYLHKLLLKFVLRKADYILSTSHSMAKEAEKYVNRKIDIIPFGIDSSLFSPNRVKHDIFTIGCTKSLLPIYGIDKLIRAFAIVLRTIDAKLVLVGDGPERSNLQRLTNELGINERVSFEGRKANNQLPAYYNKFDVAVYLSRSESFGVVALEAMACECPLIVSKAAGFMEVVPVEAGVFVDAEEEDDVACQIITLAQDKERRIALGKEGRKHVVKSFCWSDNVKQMEKFYMTVLVK